ncbi:DUF6113 family protein [Nonomuraea sp. NPDC050328]|uniref:DUF6113 family protein n=1 Tax=Nonomuraea sp. NPDC050328 TaxID=3364361 RepID=UPI003787839A
MESALAGMAYGMLSVLGVVVGVVGAFNQAWPLGGLPAAAVAWVLTIFVVCLAAGRMMRSRLGAAAVAAGWLLTSMLFVAQPAAGDYVFFGEAGTVYLYGGMAAVAAAFLFAPASKAMVTGQGPGSVPGSTASEPEPDPADRPRPGEREPREPRP